MHKTDYNMGGIIWPC